jgi:hypothetical protein
MIKFTVEGNTNNTDAFLAAMMTDDPYSKVESHAQRGVNALQAATPVDSGETAASWSYEIRQNGSGFEIVWLNHHVIAGFSVAVGLQYGHGTGSGGYVQGRDFINPALRSIFDQIANDVWKEVQES